MRQVTSAGQGVRGQGSGVRTARRRPHCAADPHIPDLCPLIPGPWPHFFGMEKERILILGVGNVLLGDEGVGVHAARRLGAFPFPPGVTVVDGGTGGFHLLPYFDDCDSMIMIDAAMDGQRPGTVSVLEPRFASDFPKALSAHDIGLRDLVESAVLLDSLPRIHLITVSIEEMQPMCMELSPPVSESLPGIEHAVCSILSNNE